MKGKEKPLRTVVERYYLTHDELKQTERQVLLQEHLKRYGAMRRFCYGKVLDFAAGCGYGAFMIAGNPDVEHVYAVDGSKEAIAWGKEHFAHPKITYKTQEARAVSGKYDTLVCLETVEHIKDTSIIPSIVKRCNIDNVIVSFPDKKTTHYNPHHFHDFVRQDIVDLFPEHMVYHIVRFADSTSVLLIRTPKKAPHELFRNLRDL
jgi:2-polyprenyl-3-methyl-5-hydroxy-6-metoxy-1,4-benzoquinol methylase